MIKKQEDIIIAGFGGQGVLLAGMILAQAAIEDGKHTTWFPSYGAEMRGGTANSTVIISDEEIGSPVVVNPSVLLVMNEPSLNKFSPKLKPGALVIYNASLIKKSIDIPGVRAVGVPATECAHRDIGNVRTANMVMLGLLLKENSTAKLASAKIACGMAFEGKPALVAANEKALEAGFNYKG